MLVEEETDEEVGEAHEADTLALPPWIAMDSYQLIAPSIKTFDSYPQGRVR